MMDNSCCRNRTSSNQQAVPASSLNTQRGGIVNPVGDIPNMPFPPLGESPVVEPSFPIGDLPVRPSPPIGQLPVEPSPPIAQIPSRPQPPVFVVGGSTYRVSVCLDQMSYIWTTTGESFWAYPTSIESNVVHGYRWNERAGWFLYEIPVSRIRFMICTQD